jgi:hypothetical protein
LELWITDYYVSEIDDFAELPHVDASCRFCSGTQYTSLTDYRPNDLDHL